MECAALIIQNFSVFYVYHHGMFICASVKETKKTTIMPVLSVLNLWSDCLCGHL